MARTPKSHRLTIANTRQTIDCAANQTVLEAAIAAGIDYPYACATGNCGTASTSARSPCCRVMTPASARSKSRRGRRWPVAPVRAATLRLPG